MVLSALALGASLVHVLIDYSVGQYGHSSSENVSTGGDQHRRLWTGLCDVGGGPCMGKWPSEDSRRLRARADDRLDVEAGTGGHQGTARESDECVWCPRWALPLRRP